MIDLPDSLPPAPPPPPTITMRWLGGGKMDMQITVDDLDLAEMMLVTSLQKVMEQRLAQKQTVVQAVQGMPPPALALLRNGRR